ncbi:unnamed protein product [Cuscuta europaea]|uniref:Uncharacterized protein n=1 Tax=Cuscuta europaea TaxID=41803 RepID=A0A9P1EI38_CUSEU|nr:unnamed protein product [Cuscuta europaea]
MTKHTVHQRVYIETLGVTLRHTIQAAYQAFLFSFINFSCFIFFFPSALEHHSNAPTLLAHIWSELVVDSGRANRPGTGPARYCAGPDRPGLSVRSRFGPPGPVM